MFTAEQARKYRLTPTQKEIDNIESKIMGAVISGSDCVQLYEYLPVGMEDFLKKHGYTVDVRTDRDGLLVTIAWGK